MKINVGNDIGSQGRDEIRYGLALGGTEWSWTMVILGARIPASSSSIPMRSKIAIWIGTGAVSIVLAIQNLPGFG